MSCGINDVFHFQGEPQRCLYCLEQLVAVLVDDRDVVRCVKCRLRYAADLLTAAGTERILTHPERFHVERIPPSDFLDVEPAVLITDLDLARSVLAERGDDL